MDIVGENLKRARPAPAREPFGELMGVLARPLARAYGWMGSAPAAIYLQSLLVAGPALWSVSHGTWLQALGAGLLVAFAHVLVRAARVLGRARGADAWTVFLDRFVQSLHEAGLFAAAWWMHAHPPAGLPGLLDPVWRPRGLAGGSAVIIGAFAALGLHRAMDAMHDLLTLRSHLLGARRVPGPTALGAVRRRAHIPRDLTLALWVAGLLTQQWELVGGALLVLHAGASVASVARFRSRSLSGGYEDEASRILAPDYL